MKVDQFIVYSGRKPLTVWATLSDAISSAIRASFKETGRIVVKHHHRDGRSILVHVVPRRVD